MFINYGRDKAQLKKGFKLEPKSSSPSLLNSPLEVVTANEKMLV